MQVSVAFASAVEASEREIALLRALQLINGDRALPRAAGDLRFSAQLICRAAARNQPIPPSLSSLGLTVMDVGPMLVLAKKLEDA